MVMPREKQSFTEMANCNEERSLVNKKTDKHRELVLSSTLFYKSKNASKIAKS